MPGFMHFAFLDEWGTVVIPGGSHFLVAALLNIYRCVKKTKLQFCKNGLY